ncbi:MAG: 50S ribosomal protein L10 [Ruminiclostridium sp.]|nr:50S ribosomal protein L10 [Ruminiclostridium sp.]
MASEKIIAQKQQYVDELTKKLENAAGGVLVDYRGITVAEDTALRKALREAGVDYFVVKNTLLRRAAEKAGITGIEEHLEGTTALALHESDIISAPKILYKQAQDCGDARFNIKIGFIGKEAISVQEVEEYAKLPSKEVLISKLLFMLQSPMQRLAIAASEIAKKKEEEGAA